MRDKIPTPFFLRQTFSLLAAIGVIGAIAISAIGENKFSDWIEAKLQAWLGLTVPDMLSALVIPLIAEGLIIWLVFEVGRSYKRHEVEQDLIVQRKRADIAEKELLDLRNAQASLEVIFEPSESPCYREISNQRVVSRCAQ